MNMLISKEEVIDWCESNYIENFTVNDDLVVDVDSDVILYLVPMEILPVQFGYVNGDFILGENGLTSLKGVPHTVKGDFICGGNMITDLEYLPASIGSRIILLNNNIDSCISPLQVANNIIWISTPIPGLTYLEIDENGYYKYNIDDYLQWNLDSKNFMEDNLFFI